MSYKPYDMRHQYRTPAATIQSTNATEIQRWYLINLDRRPDRLAEATEELERAGIEFTRFAAVDGSKLPLPSGEHNGAGAYGCRMSHLGVLQDALLNGLECIGVLEDDIVLCPDFKLRLTEFMSALPSDWEMAYFGTQHRQTPTPVNRNVVRCTDCHRTHSWTARGSGIRRLYKIWSEDHGHVDHILGKGHFRELKAYASTPLLVGQGQSHSDINGRTNQERWWGPKARAAKPTPTPPAAPTPEHPAADQGEHQGDTIKAANGTRKPCNCGKRKPLPMKPMRPDGT